MQRAWRIQRSLFLRWVYLVCLGMDGTGDMGYMDWDCILAHWTGTGLGI
jgi:hypothetical protein